MAQFAAFIDYGFLDAAGATALSVKKRAIKPNARGCIEWLRSIGEQLPAKPTFLRAYWYDAAFDPADPRYPGQRRYFDAIGSTPGISLRLGHLRERPPPWHYPLKKTLERFDVDIEEFEKHFPFRPEMSQKGVDTLITLDMVRLAQRRAYDIGILIAGDRDLAEPVRAAQDEGRRIILAVPHQAGVAPELRQLADDVLTLDDAALGCLLSVNSAQAS